MRSEGLEGQAGGAERALTRRAENVHPFHSDLYFELGFLSGSFKGSFKGYYLRGYYKGSFKDSLTGSGFTALRLI